MFADKFVTSFRRIYNSSPKRSKLHRVDVMADQVKKMLQDSDQKLILAVRS